MASKPDNIILSYLQRIECKLDRVGEDVRELKTRMTAVNDRLIAVIGSMDSIDRRLGNIESRMVRISGGFSGDATVKA